jgi:hypothetical protein
VRLLDENGTVVASTTTDSGGQYAFSSMEAGQYRLEFERQGFKKNVIAGLGIAPGDNQQNNQLQVGSATEMVAVTGANSAQFSTSMASVAGTASPRIANRPHVNGGYGAGNGAGAGGGISAIPMNGRQYTMLAMLAPGAANLDKAREMSSAAASGQDLGDLFEYKLKDPVTLKKNQSALVPIVQTDIEAEKVSLWNGTAGSGRPLRALWVKNISALTLDGGSFSVLESEVFAGEGLTETIKPGERRLLSYATDLGLLVEAVQTSQPIHVTRVKIYKGTMTQVSELHESVLYTVRNQDESVRTLVIEHPARVGTVLAKGTKVPDEFAPGVYRFKVEVAAKATASLPVEEVRVLSSAYQIADLDNDQIGVFVQNGTLTPDMAQALKKISAQKAVVSKLEAEMENRQKDIDRIVEDQARLRENMKALKGSAEEKALLQRYTRQLDQQETQLETLRKTIQDTEAERDKANEELERRVAGLELEATF